MTISFKVSENTKEKAIEYFKDKRRAKTPAYAIFQADEEDTVVTLYESGSMVFQGVSADIDANIWKATERRLNPTKKLEEKKKKEAKDKTVNPIDKKLYYATTIGSDEVGTGDFFGPIVVTSSYVTKDDIPFLEELGVRDSKKITDEKIMDVVPKIIKRIPYKSLIVSNSDYNKSYSKDLNMNKIKAILHNKVLNELTDKYKDTDYVVVDQFAKEMVYYSYLKNTPKVCRNITFTTKAEDKCLSVACASMISRYIFIKEFDKLGQSIDMFLPKGAGTNVDEVAQKIVQKYGYNKLYELAKMNFKNAEKLKTN